MKKGMTAELEAPVIPTTIPGIAALILYLSVNLHEVSRAGKSFRWSRPLEYWRGFWAAASSITTNLWLRIERGRWLASYSCQRLEYWWRGLERCRAIRGRAEDLEELLDSGQIVVTHSPAERSWLRLHARNRS